MHYVISFKENEIDKEKAMELTSKFIERNFENYEVFSALHTDRKHTHVHIVINSVNYDNGKKYLQSNKDMYNLKKSMNELCKEYGLEIPQKTNEKGKIISWDKNKYMGMKMGIEKDESDIVILAKDINDVSHQSKSKEEFISKMSEKGYKVEWKEERKNIVFEIDKLKLKGKKNRFRLSNLEKTFNDKIFTKEGLENEFIQAREREYTREIRRNGNGKNGTLEEKLAEIRGRENEAERRISQAVGELKSRAEEKSRTNGKDQGITREKSKDNSRERENTQRKIRSRTRDKGIER